MQISRHWRLNAQRYTLQGVTCPHCSANIFPPREVCPYCEGQVQNAYHFGQETERQAAAVGSALDRAAR